MLLVFGQPLQQHDFLFLQVCHEEDDEISATSWSALLLRKKCSKQLWYALPQSLLELLLMLAKHDRTVCLLHSLIRRPSEVQVAATALYCNSNDNSYIA